MKRTTRVHSAARKGWSCQIGNTLESFKGDDAGVKTAGRSVGGAVFIAATEGGSVVVRPVSLEAEVSSVEEFIDGTSVGLSVIGTTEGLSVGAILGSSVV